MQLFERVLFGFTTMWTALFFGMAGFIAGLVLDQWLSPESASLALGIRLAVVGVVVGVGACLYQVHLSVVRTVDPAYAETIRSFLAASPRRFGGDDALRMAVNLIFIGSLAFLFLATR